MKKIALLLITAFFLQADEIVVPGDEYLISSDDGSLEVIYDKNLKKEASLANSFEKEVLRRYERSYGYALDCKLHLGILSANNQIANAFSTQFPLNMQMNYIAGSEMIDYMSSTSWLKTLLLHESAHNFQINPKKNRLSNIAHKIVGNLPVTSLFFVPLFPVPNALESSFMFEGNAVFNESRFNNGGRLYNGALLALSITQAKAGYITPKRTYNSHLYFPYNAHHYIVGGFFQLYLAQKYGTNSVNRYFWNFSGQYLPIQTSAIFIKTFGKDYESEIKEYSNWLSSEFSGFKESRGELIATSKFDTKLNSDKDEIFFLTSDAKSRPELKTISKKGTNLKSKKADYLFGRIFKVGNKYYSQASRHTEVQKIEMGLFDDQGRVFEESRSKIVQSQLSDGRFVYFDVNRSFDQAALYVGDEFYSYVNSSVFCDDEDNIYYFKQEGKKRTLYKNKAPILSFKGYYGFVADVNEEGIYFVANSKYGSSLYLYDGDIYRVTDADDIVDAKLLDKNRAIVETITAEGLKFIKIPLSKTRSTVYERSYYFEKEEDFNFSFEMKKRDLVSKPYESYRQMHYSSLNQSVVFNEDSIDFSVGANFIDPLGQNSASVYISRYDEETLSGVRYENSANRLKYGMDLYGVVEKDKNISSRDFGANLFLEYPLYRAGYKRVDLNMNYYIDHDRDEREPLSLSVNYSDARKFGFSMYHNSLNDLSLFGVRDRDDFIVGAGLNIVRDFDHEFYTGLSFKYAKSDTDRLHGKYGVKVDDTLISVSGDPSHVVMPSIDFDIYAKDVFKAGVSIYKVLNFDAYSFTVPLSLRRESLYAKYNYYDMTFLDDRSKGFSEYILGSSFDLLFLHKNPIPLSFEYIYNGDLKDSSRFRVLFDLPL